MSQGELRASNGAEGRKDDRLKKEEREEGSN